MLILVTGASKGIGLELVRKFSAERGAMVLAVSRNIVPVKKAIAEKQLHNVMALKADLSLAADLEKIKKTVARIGMPLRVLVNNAGLLIKKEFGSFRPADLRLVYETNVFAPFLLVQKLVPLMEEKKTHILNISSMGGVQGSAKFPGLSAYSSSKGAVCVLTECLAAELAPHGISCNCLALGAVATEMLATAFPGYKAPLSAAEMAGFIAGFALGGNKFFNGKIIPVALSTP